MYANLVAIFARGVGEPIVLLQLGSPEKMPVTELAGRVVTVFQSEVGSELL